MAGLTPITTIFRRRLRRRAAISLAAILINALAAFSALQVRGYHYGLVKSPFISPIAFDVSLDRLAVKSECIQWADVKIDNLADRYCRTAVEKLDNLTLEEASSRVCGSTDYLNVSTVGSICATLSSLRSAGSFVATILTLTIMCDILLAVLAVLLSSLASDPFAFERVDKGRPAHRAVCELIDGAEADRLEGLRDAYDRQSMRLAMFRTAIRVGTTLSLVLFIWAPLMYPFIGENIHMNTMPLFNMWLGRNPASDGTSLSVGYVILCMACAVRFVTSFMVLVLLVPDLTQPLILQKQALAESRSGRAAQYNGTDDMIVPRASVGLNPFSKKSRTVRLNDQVVDQELHRLLDYNVSPMLVVGGTSVLEDDW